MAVPVFYQTLNMVGIDPTLFYTNLATAGGSILPEYPAPPFIPGTRAFGSDGSEFIFVQASTSISLTDFVVVNAGNTVNNFMANSITTTNAVSSSAVNMAVASSGLVLKQSVSFIPAGAMFWAMTKGNFVPASTSANFSSMPAGSGVVLYTTTSAGQLAVAASVASSAAGASVAFAGFNIVSSISISIAASIVPAGIGQTQSNGFTVGPVVSMNNPRTIIVTGQGTGTYTSGVAYW